MLTLNRKHSCVLKPNGSGRDARNDRPEAGATSSSRALVSLFLDQSDPPLVFRLADFTREGATGFFKAGKIPEVRKLTTLPGLHGLHGAIVTFKKDAAAVRFFLQSQPATIPSQPRELLDEIGFAHALESGEPGNFPLRQAHLSRPAAAGGATLTFKENWHVGNLWCFEAEEYVALRHRQHDLVLQIGKVENRRVGCICPTG